MWKALSLGNTRAGHHELCMHHGGFFFSFSFLWHISFLKARYKPFLLIDVLLSMLYNPIALSMSPDYWLQALAVSSNNEVND